MKESQEAIEQLKYELIVTRLDLNDKQTSVYALEAEKRKRENESALERLRRAEEEEKAALRVTFSWMDPLDHPSGRSRRIG